MKIIIIDQPRADSSQINNKLWYIFIINKKMWQKYLVEKM